MSHPYLISRIADPIFALLIGSSAAVLRIQRDMRDQQQQHQQQQQQQLHSQSQVPDSAAPPTAATKEDDVSLSKIAEIGARRVGLWWRGEFQGL